MCLLRVTHRSSDRVVCLLSLLQRALVSSVVAGVLPSAKRALQLRLQHVPAPSQPNMPSSAYVRLSCLLSGFTGDAFPHESR
jgi:hypothetical protein